MGATTTSAALRSALAVVMVCVLAGCRSAEDADEPADPTSSSPSSQSSSTPGEVPTEPTVELPESTPLVEPATGPRLDVEGASVRAPEGWEPGYDTPFAATSSGPQGRLTFSSFPAKPRSLRALLRRELASPGARRYTSVRRLEDVTMGGRTAYHFRARAPFSVIDGFGMHDAGNWASVTFDLEDRVPEKRRRALIESVVASYESDL